MFLPVIPSFDAARNIWVPHGNNDRILEYDVNEAGAP